MNFEYPVIIADVGGTNARFMLLESKEAQPIYGPVLKLKNHNSIEQAFDEAIDNHFKQKPKTVVMALACPIVGETYALTNANWLVTPEKFIQYFDLKSLYIMNDFVAQGLGAISASRDSLLKVGGGVAVKNAIKIILGPGTGLGIVIALQNSKNVWHMLPGEGGHMDLGPREKREFDLWPYLKKQKGRMEAELAISGQGLENIHQAIVQCDGLQNQFTSPLSAAEITQTYYDTKETSCGEAISLMVSLLARVAGDLTVLTMPKGGVYLSGGITKFIKGFITDNKFREEFENKVPFQHIMKEIPIYIMEDEQPALSGMANLVVASSEFNLDNAIRHFSNDADA